MRKRDDFKDPPVFKWGQGEAIDVYPENSHPERDQWEAIITLQFQVKQLKKEVDDLRTELQKEENR